MSESKKPPPEHDPSAELGLRNPVRDQERIGEQKYSVTPPRSKVRAPEDSESGKVSCRACSAELDPTRSYRIDAEEYVYHFCGTECYARWRENDDRADAAAR
ncbi:MAG: DUF3330 domain-containing protein [Burkholderiales bacterium]